MGWMIMHSMHMYIWLYTMKINTVRTAIYIDSDSAW